MYQLIWIFHLSTVILPRSKIHLILQKTRLGQSRVDNIIKVQHCLCRRDVAETSQV